MAQKRMFSLQIVDTDAFLDMPLSSQLLYFHLTMRADDEGFIGNPKKIMRLIGVQDDDMKILLAKRFILSFESGVVVIKHWLIHNTIRMDRFNKTSYGKEKMTLEVCDNKAYTELATTRQPNDNQLVPQVKLSKVKLSKVSYMADEETIDILFWNEYPEKVAKAKALQVWNKMTDEEKQKAIVAIKKQVEAKHFRGRDGKDYVPHPATWLNQRRWEDEIKEIKNNSVDLRTKK